ncbi:MAG: ABC transporter permease [Synergistaceae bacterium]|jgi:peptide/nickel transport system permease protein|nr:ABC transporter permease [Synergistaceae bacterium]
MRRGRNSGAFFTAPILITGVILTAVAVLTFFAPVFAPMDPNRVALSESLEPPSLRHLLGTDQTGRDIFSRLLYGGRTAVQNAVMVVGISIAAGIPIGLACGYYGGLLDALVMRCWDILLAFPSLLLGFLFVSAFGRGSVATVLALGIIYIPMISKLSRSLAMTEKSKVYVESAKSLGYSDFRIIFRHILPNCLATLLAELTLDVGYAIIGLASLSFLGLGVQPPTSDWGTMLQEGVALLRQNPLMSLSPGFAIVLTVISLNVFSDGIQAYLDIDQRKLPRFEACE